MLFFTFTIEPAEGWCLKVVIEANLSGANNLEVEGLVFFLSMAFSCFLLS